MWIKITIEKFFDTGTPTLFVNGTKFDGFDTATITTAVDQALGR